MSKSIVQYINTDSVAENVKKTLGRRAPQFVASVASLVKNNDKLANCDKQSVLGACLTAAALDLPFNKELSLAHIIPYGNEAQFQMDWKGYVELALRTKRYKHINVSDVREGEYDGKNRLTGEDKFNWIDDDLEREKLEIVGYVSYFELTEGFSKTLYMTVNELKEHAGKYSASYKSKSKKMNMWRDDFEKMGKKTVVKLLIKRWGPKSAEINQALVADQASIDDDGNLKYPDRGPVKPEDMASEKEREKLLKHIKNAKKVSDLMICKVQVEAMRTEFPDEVVDAFDDKLKELETEE